MDQAMKKKKDPRDVAFTMFDEMQPRDIIKVADCAPKKPELFIEFGKEYINQGGQLMFSRDYTIIYKTLGPDDFSTIQSILPPKDTKS